jgi:hypothetical protein
VLAQKSLEPSVGAASRVVADRDSGVQIRAAQDIVRSPVLEEDHDLGIDVASTSGIRRYEIAFVRTLVVVADALVASLAGPGGVLPPPSERQ